MIRKVGITAGDRLAACEFLRLQSVSIRRQHEFRLRLGRRRARLQCGKRACDLARSGDGDVDIVRLQDAAEVGLVRLALAQALERRLLVPEGLQEGEGKFLRVERLLGEGGYSLFDFDGVHGPGILQAWRNSVGSRPP